MGFYERLENLRKNAGIGQGKLEKELGIANGSISKWKNRTPKYVTLEKLAEYFNVSVDYLVNGDSTENTSTTQNLDIFASVGGLKDGFTPNTVKIQFIDEPELTLHSKHARDLVKSLEYMSEEDIKLLASTALRISPKQKKAVHN